MAVAILKVSRHPGNSFRHNKMAAATGNSFSRPRRTSSVVRPAVSDQEIGNLLDLNNSDIELSDNDTEYDWTEELQIQTDCGSIDSSDAETSEDEEDELPLAQVAAKQALLVPPSRQRWIHTEIFEPLPPGPPLFPDVGQPVSKAPYDYFSRYIPASIFEKIAFCTNARGLEMSGKVLNFTASQVEQFLGMSVAMSCLRFPRTRMYWERGTRIPMIVDTMPRNKFFLLRNNLKLVVDNDIPQEQKEKNKCWKLQPLLECVRVACLTNPRTHDISIDEQMIPFWGKTKMRQFVRGKPNPCGLKNFVMTTPSGQPLDFFIYEGKGSIIVSDEETDNLDVGGRVVVFLSKSLPQGVTIYTDRFFTSVKLLDLMFSKGITMTGTIQKSRLPCYNSFLSDRELKKLGRGAVDQLVRRDEQVAAIKWYDNKPVVLVSSAEGKEPMDKCRRWSKNEAKKIEVDRPAAVARYNMNMGGIDFLDRVISYYRMSARTKKWTIRMIHHMLDFAIASSWIEYREAEGLLGSSKKDVKDYFQFRMDIAYKLIYSASAAEQQAQNSDEDETDPELENTNTKKRRKPTPHPPNSLRKHQLGHLPNVTQGTGNRCRKKGCTSTAARMYCPTCKVYLCLTKERNCYRSYHESE